MSRIHIATLLVVGAITVACGPAISQINYAPGLARAPNCDVDVYPQGTPVPYSSSTVADVTVGDTGFSLDCNATKVMAVLRERACAAGADAIQLYDVEHPDFYSTCFRATARLLRYNDAPPLESRVAVTKRTGTGWVSELGLIVTNYHVVAGASRVNVEFQNGRVMSAEILVRDSANDLALLALNGDVELPRGLSLAVRPGRLGAEVVTVGFPQPDLLGASPKASVGIISGTSGLQDDPRTYQISVPVQAGNSGGPLFNRQGEVLGVVTSKLNALEVFRWTGDLPENVNYAVKSLYVRGLFDTMSNRIAHPTIDLNAVGLDEVIDAVLPAIVLIVAQ